jgi:hypothetical protein
MDNDEQPPHNNHGVSLRLPLFWAENSEAWFGKVAGYCTYSHKGRGGGVEPERWLVKGATVHEAGSKIQT